jgi:glycolate oxidase iron-sulfur subunit
VTETPEPAVAVGARAEQPPPVGVLGLDPDGLASCVSCGMCLPHCPTFRVTGDELASPRGRIALMRRVEAGEGVIDDDFTGAMASCVQCRGCEPACPSAVPFGHLMEATRAALASGPRPVPRWQRAGYAVLGRHRLLLALSTATAVAQRARVVPRRLLPYRLPVRRPTLRASGTDVWLHTGCVMDAWQRPVHAAALRVLEASGFGVALPPPARSGCCGALHVHAGLEAEARRLAEGTIATFPGEAPIVVDSAGCGAALLDVGRLVGTPAAEAFSARVVDIHGFLAAHAGRLPAARRRHPGPVAVQDPCHLRHVQRAHEHVRTVLRPYVEELVELDDDGLCCGAGGAYAALQPDLAARVRERKIAAVARSGAILVASANPGCLLHLRGHLAAAGVGVAHPVELIDQALAR